MRDFSEASLSKPLDAQFHGFDLIRSHSLVILVSGPAFPVHSERPD